tara:strand:+ start:56 stop:373 length:318 start_codon:yes stop_codon:yes gene_type:complete
MKILSALIVLLIPSSLFAEIKDRRIYENFYDACMAQKTSTTTMSEMNRYCECSGNRIMKDFTLGEIMLIERDIALAKNEEEEIQIAYANDKLFNIIVQCSEEVFN